MASPLILLGLISPSILKPIQKPWMILAILMGWFVTRVILSIFYFLVITPIAFVSKLFGKEFLNLKFNVNDEDSYWVIRKEKEFEREHYENQF